MVPQLRRPQARTLSVDDLRPTIGEGQPLASIYGLRNRSGNQESLAGTLETYLDYVCTQLATESGVAMRAISYYQTDLRGGHAFGEGGYSTAACLHSLLALLREGGRYLLEHAATMPIRSSSTRFRDTGVRRETFCFLFWGLGDPSHKETVSPDLFAAHARPTDADFPSLAGDAESTRSLVDFFVSMKIAVRVDNMEQASACNRDYNGGCCQWSAGYPHERHFTSH